MVDACCLDLAPASLHGTITSPSLTIALLTMSTRGRWKPTRSTSRCRTKLDKRVRYTRNRTKRVIARGPLTRATYRRIGRKAERLRCSTSNASRKETWNRVKKPRTNAFANRSPRRRDGPTPLAGNALTRPRKNRTDRTPLPWTACRAWAIRNRTLYN